MIICDDDQGTPGWFAARLGRPSASNFSKLITSAGKPSASASDYIYKLAAERISQTVDVGFKSDAMQRGNDLEEEARQYYEFISGNDVLQVGFILHESLEFGCSPDGLIGESGGLEIKAPSASTHLKYLESPNKMPTEYFQQVQGCLYVTGREWWDFLSYHPNMPHYLIRVTRDEAFISRLAEELDSAIGKILQKVEKYNENRSDHKHQSF